jgi:hypothetical protein
MPVQKYGSAAVGRRFRLRFCALSCQSVALARHTNPSHPIGGITPGVEYRFLVTLTNRVEWSRAGALRLN